MLNKSWLGNRAAFYFAAAVPVSSSRLQPEPKEMHGEADLSRQNLLRRGC
jgi:hypothetical protein